MAAAIPRGIQVVQWKNQDKSRQVRYRVRINRADFKADKLFDTLDDAKDFLAASKSSTGRDGLAAKERELEEKRLEMQAKLADWFREPKLNVLLKRYRSEAFPEPAKDSPKHRGWKAMGWRINAILATKIPNITRETRENFTGRVAIPSILAKVPKIAFGEFDLRDVSPGTVSDFIKARLESVSASTVQRELNLLRAFHNDQRRSDPKSLEGVEGNPFSNYNKRLLADRVAEREPEDGRLPDKAEERLFAELRKMRNPEMAQIVALALATGMRRGEILRLEWSRVEERRLRLLQTKSGKPRWVPLNEDAQAILKTVKRRQGDPRLFHYTDDGFATNWQRLRQRAELGPFRFHDTRREFISRLIETLSSPIAAARVVQMKDVRHFEQAYVEPAKEHAASQREISSEDDLMRAVGHSSKRMTAHYYAEQLPSNAEGKGKAK
ncbi:site-specific integrase [Cupriavidus metallidurans]|uniref:site-specific integrase n=1 Tax=Cupriavidus metallidurans TaxID=119219 RepID=UPI000CE03B80|nr:site-specific integrase [Cupriavidus metallidurans]AVA36283.1 hypothetical protein C3Z06_23505 [Cupriavidus metallidurans]